MTLLTFRFSLLRCLLILLAGFLSACGGGGGGGASSQPPQLDTNANLASLELIGAAVEQAFDPSVTSYTAVVGFLLDTVSVNATAAGTGASLTINNSAPGVGGNSFPLQEGNNDIVVVVTAEDGNSVRTYTVTVTRQTADAFAQDSYVKASNTQSTDTFGYSVAVSGNTMAVGARTEDSGATGVNGDQADNSVQNSGAVYVFVRDSSGDWTQQAYLKASNTRGSAFFGESLALSGDTLAVGAIGDASAATGIDGNQTDSSANLSGAVYVFGRDVGGAWSQRAYLKASNTDAGDQFGSTLALFEDTLVVAAPDESCSATGINGNESDNSSASSGAAYVFIRGAGGGWSQQAYLKASNTDAGDRFGTSLALDENTLAIGADAEASSALGINGDQTSNAAAGAGAVYVFTRDGGNQWSQQAYIKSSNANAGDAFGAAVALDDDTLAVGAVAEAGGGRGVGANQNSNAAVNSGAAYVFARDSSGTWSQQIYIKASNADPDDAFGKSVALQDGLLAVAAWQESGDSTIVNGNQFDNSEVESGAAYLFERDAAGTWIQRAYVKVRNSDARDFLGFSMALDGELMVLGSLAEDGAATGVNGDESDNSVLSAGAAYVFGGTPKRDAALASLQLDDVALDQTFQSSQTNYSAAVGFLNGSVTLRALGLDPNVVTRVDGVRFTSDGLEIVLTEGQNSIEVEATAEDGVTSIIYTLDISRDNVAEFAQQAYVKASNPESNDFFGNSVAIYGDLLAVGAYQESSAATGIGGDESDNTAPNAGAVYVFARDGAGMWLQQAYIKASNAETDDRFGESIALSGTTLVVGAFGEASAASGIDGDETDNSLSQAGAVYVFVSDSNGVWSQQAYLKASNAGSGDQFGLPVALDGDTLVVGARFERSAATGIDGDQSDNSLPLAGAAYVFARDAQGGWSQQSYLKASNTDGNDLFGGAVAVYGDTVVVGARQESGGSTGVDGDDTTNTAVNSGAAYIYTRDNVGTWVQQAYVKSSNSEAGDQFGNRVAIFGDTLAVSARFESGGNAGVNGDESDNSASTAGAVYAFIRDASGNWAQQAYIKSSNIEMGDSFGTSLALRGNTLVVGASFEDSAAVGVNGNELDNSVSASGAVYAFMRDASGIWSQRVFVKASNTGPTDLFGSSVALHAETLASGAIFESSGAAGVNGDETDDSAGNAGATYVLQ